MKRVLFLMFISLSIALKAAQLPPGFVEQLLAQNLDPTDLVMAPDGRIFITIKSGKILIVENGVLSPNPFLDIPVYTYNEAGLCHIVLDPNFDVNHYYYIYYTVSDASHNRVSRFTANGNFTLPGSEVVVLDLDPGSIHNGGDMAFGLDGKLYIAVGEGDNTSNPQSFGSLLGKVLRLNRDGTVPSDNPFFNVATVIGRNKAIWALGFRNPYSMDIQPGTGKIFVTDAGAELAEEIDEVQAGKNYGWPLIEGMRTNEPAPANYQDPLYAYLHGFTPFTGCAVVGAAFYNPTVNQFPNQYVGQFFYADYCNGYINYIDPVTLSAHTFANGISRPMAILVAPDGTLYYLARAGLDGTPEANTSTNDGTLWKVTYTGSGIPVISVQPKNALAVENDNINFITAASGTQPLSYQWMVNGLPIIGATLASYTFNNAQLTDTGKKFSCKVSNSLGSATTQDATLSVISNTRPVPQLTVALPANAVLYQAGQTISFTGGATDNEDGVLPPSALTWKIDFHHKQHVHPGMQPTSGIASGSFYIPKVGEPAADVWYRIILTATDTKGLTNIVYKDVFPQKVKIILNTIPPTLTLNLDGQPIHTPDTVISVVGFTRTIEAPVQETHDGILYLFSKWTPVGIDRSFTFNAPIEATSFTATYSAISLHPKNALVTVGDNVNFIISAPNAQPLSYQWMVNGLPIMGATLGNFTFTNAQLIDDGKKVSCRVSNSFGSVTTQEVKLSVKKGGQTITFGILAPATFGDTPLTLSANSSSGLPISYATSDATKVTIAGNKVTLVGAGLVNITAKQEGNTNYNPATEVTQALTVNKVDQTITFSPIPTKIFGDAPFNLAATSSSGLIVDYSTSSDKVSLSGSRVTLTKPGSVTFKADQIGNNNFNAAPSVSQTFCINPAKPVISVTGLNSGTPVLTSSSSSGNQWYKNGVLLTDAVSNTLSPTNDGSYKVKVTIDNCASEFSVEQILIITGDVPSKSTYSEFVVYPNPVKDNLTLSLAVFNSNSEVEVVLYDATGRIMDKVYRKGSETVLSVSSYSTGNYTVKVSQQSKTYVAKFVKE